MLYSGAKGAMTPNYVGADGAAASPRSRRQGRARWTPLSKQHPALRVEAVRAEFELTGVHRTSPENFIRKIAGFPKDY